MVRLGAVIAALLAVVPAVIATETCQPLPFPSGCAEPRYRPFILLESYRPAASWCSSRYPVKTPVVTRTVVATARQTITGATATVTDGTKVVRGSTVTVTAATVTVTATTVTQTVETLTVATNTVTTASFTASPVSATVSTVVLTDEVIFTVTTATVATVTVTVTATESDGALITLPVPPIIQSLLPREDVVINGGINCQRGDYLCSIFDDLAAATSTFADYICSCLETAWPKPATKTTTVHLTDTIKTTVTATLDETITLTRDRTAKVTATALATATDEVTALATASATATVIITPTVLVTATTIFTDVNSATASATETDTATVTVGCLAATPTPAGDTCGTNYVYIGESNEKVISSGPASTTEGCALSCSQTTNCLSFAFSAPLNGGSVGVCNLYSGSVAQLQSGMLITLPSGGLQDIMAFYDIGCFVCPAPPATPPGRRQPLGREAAQPAIATVTLTEIVERTRVETVVDMRVQTMWQRCAGR